MCYCILEIQIMLNRKECVTSFHLLRVKGKAANEMLEKYLDICYVFLECYTAHSPLKLYYDVINNMESFDIIEILFYPATFYLTVIHRFLKYATVLLWSRCRPQ